MAQDITLWGGMEKAEGSETGTRITSVNGDPAGGALAMAKKQLAISARFYLTPSERSKLGKTKL
jgi:hypothetical protein